MLELVFFDVVHHFFGDSLDEFQIGHQTEVVAVKESGEIGDEFFGDGFDDDFGSDEHSVAGFLLFFFFEGDAQMLEIKSELDELVVFHVSPRR